MKPVEIAGPPGWGQPARCELSFFLLLGEEINRPPQDLAWGGGREPDLGPNVCRTGSRRADEFRPACLDASINLFNHIQFHFSSPQDAGIERVQFR
jgi:hypothetical protein